MIKKVMILGAAGNFGSKIAKKLAYADIPLILVGRNQQNLHILKHDIEQDYPKSSLQLVTFDIEVEITKKLHEFKPFIVINTCGPFQKSNYNVALASINLGIHYIDLADCRKFVNDFTLNLNNIAEQKKCLAVTGASTVPCLSSAVLEYFKPEFNSMDSLIFGITPGQRTKKGLATTASVLSYLGKQLNFYPGLKDKIYGWQDLYLQAYPVIGKRWMANCDIPDLDLLPKHYGLKFIKFSAGMESITLHFGMWLFSWLVRFKLINHLENYAEPLLKLSSLLDYFGTDEGGMHMIIRGKDKSGKSKIVKWFIIARKNHGPCIPAIPAIILTKKLIKNEINQVGAVTSIGLVTLEEYLNELREFDVKTYVM